MHSSGGVIFPNYVALLFIMLLSYGIPGYINNLWLIPRFLLRGRYLVYSGLFLVLLTLTVIGSYYETHWVNSLVPGLNYMGNSKDLPAVYHVFPSMIMLSFMAFGKFMTEAINNQKKVDLLEREKLESELGSLRAQINPHFLFNALNTVYGMARRNDVKTADAIIKLSDILRHGLYECEDTEITIEKEIYFLNQYVEFARLRLHNADRIRLRVQADHIDQKIAPLLLIPFVENAIKHGMATDSTEGWINIELIVSQNKLIFSCINNNIYKPKHSISPSDHSGIGLRNVRRRLQLLYQHRHRLHIADDNGKYSVELNVDI